MKSSSTAEGLSMTVDTSAVCVLSARGLEKIIEEGGSQAWVLDAHRARNCKYVVVVQNRDFERKGDDWGNVSAEHHNAFIVGKLKDVVPSSEQGNGNRWMLLFSEYAELDIPDAWPGNRNPVFYTSLQAMNINPSSLHFVAMPEANSLSTGQPAFASLTIAQAKEGLSRTFGVDPSAIQITISA